jgi:hypothetical protein
VPNSQNADCLSGDLVAHLVPTDDDAANFPRLKFLQFLAETGEFQEAARCYYEQLHRMSRRGTIYWSEKIVKSRKVR